MPMAGNGKDKGGVAAGQHAASLTAALAALLLFLPLAVSSLAWPRALLADEGVRFEGGLRVIPRTAAEAARIGRVLRPPSGFLEPEAHEALPAGAASARRRTDRNAFSEPSANISFARELDFKVGNGLFRKLWVSSPSSTLASDGLGPVFNSRSCQTCHIKDGRGHPPAGADDGRVSMVLALYRFHGSDGGGEGTLFETGPDPVYGDQLQDLSVAGIEAEGRLRITYDSVQRYLGDGTGGELRRPKYEAAGLAHGDLDPATSVSARVAPQMIGLGLLEAIPASDIIALADPGDRDGDGISGVARMVVSDENGDTMLGRFGYKASEPTIREQSAKAMHVDIGLSNPLYPLPWGDCTDAQEECVEAPHGDDEARGGFEVGHEALELFAFYSRNLAVPRRSDHGDPTVLKGKSLFHEAGCATCHRPKFVTHRLEGQDEQSFQLIWPYTDMLLHDMGEGLADQGAENPLAREWRTAPLWGIGLTEQVSGHSFFLHDGRARNLTEAIMWHGGEARASRDRFAELSGEEREAMLEFLKSL